MVKWTNGITKVIDFIHHKLRVALRNKFVNNLRSLYSNLLNMLVLFRYERAMSDYTMQSSACREQNHIFYEKIFI